MYTEIDRDSAQAKRSTDVRQKEAAKKVTVPAKGKVPGKKQEGEASARVNPLEKLKEIEWLRPTSPVFIAIALLIDRAVWTPASGFNNLLGDLKFENTAQNGGTFCKPN